MAYVKNFDFDIFISYAHNDNHPIPHKWVDKFHEHLENWLKYRRGFSELKIWRDTQLSGNTAFDLAIENKIKSSVLLISLYSTNYARSQYCRKELDCFHTHNKNRLMVGEQTRILNVLLNNISFEEWPGPFAGSSGFPMHDQETGSKEPGEFISHTNPLYEDRLHSIVDAVDIILRAFPADPVPDVGSPPGPEADEHGKIKIFIADTTDSFEDYRERVAEDAKTMGALVLDDIPPPAGNDEHESSVRQALAEADFSIHLLDQWPGKKIKDNKTTTYPCEQLNIALETDVHTFIFTPDTLNLKTVENLEYRSFLDRIINGERKPSHQYEYINATKKDLSDRIFQYMEELKKAAPATTDDTEPVFLIDTHQKDQRHAFELAAFLAENQVKVDFNMESLDPILSLTQFEKSVLHVKNLVLIFGRVSQEWLDGRIKKAFNTIAQQFDPGNALQLEKIWIYKTPDSDTDFEPGRFPPIINIAVLDNSNLSSLLQHCDQGGAK